MDDIHKAKHGSDSGVFSPTGTLRDTLFSEVFDVNTRGEDGCEEGEGDKKIEERSLGVSDLIRLHARNRVAADPAGWSFAAMEWWTTWLLLQREGRVWEGDLRGVYDGSLFYRIREERIREGPVRERREGWRQGYGFGDWWRGVWGYGNWRVWEVKGEIEPQESSNKHSDTNFKAWSIDVNQQQIAGNESLGEI